MVKVTKVGSSRADKHTHSMVEKNMEKRKRHDLARGERAKNREQKKNKNESANASRKALPLELSCEVFSFMDLPSQCQNIGLSRGIHNMFIEDLQLNWPNWERRFLKLARGPPRMRHHYDSNSVKRLTRTLGNECAERDANIQWVEQNYYEMNRKNYRRGFEALTNRMRDMHHKSNHKFYYYNCKSGMKQNWSRERERVRGIIRHLNSEYPSSFIKQLPKWLEQKQSEEEADLAELDAKMAELKKKHSDWNRCSQKMYHKLRRQLGMTSDEASSYIYLSGCRNTSKSVDL